MSHPDRRVKRLLKKQKQLEEGLGKKNNFDNKDLTPYNAVKRINREYDRLLYK